MPLMTVSDLGFALSFADPAAVVLLGDGHGPLCTVTATTDGTVILDRCDPEEILAASGVSATEGPSAQTGTGG